MPSVPEIPPEILARCETAVRELEQQVQDSADPDLLQASIYIPSHVTV